MRCKSFTYLLLPKHYWFHVHAAAPASQEVSRYEHQGGFRSRSKQILISPLATSVPPSIFGRSLSFNTVVFFLINCIRILLLRSISYLLSFLLSSRIQKFKNSSNYKRTSKLTGTTKLFERNRR